MGSARHSRVPQSGTRGCVTGFGAAIMVRTGHRAAAPPLGRRDGEDGRSRPETIAAVLTHVGDTWGGTAGYLGAHGVAAAALVRIDERLLDG